MVRVTQYYKFLVRSSDGRIKESPAEYLAAVAV